MHYVDSQRTLTRRESSVVVSKRNYADDEKSGWEVLSTAMHNTSMDSSGAGPPLRPWGSVEKEIVTMMFNSMLDNIIESWELIIPHKPDESISNIGKTVSELTFTSKKKDRRSLAKIPINTKSKSSRSKLELEMENALADPIMRTWYSTPDERAIIHFRNGNLYEGNISMKCMHGEGRFQWADGTVYLGQFKNNEMMGKGRIQWKDDTWYEGEFVGNLRHGRGLYVDSRRQRSYIGGWHCATKHGHGVIYYSETFKNSYDGEWVNNVRHGYGSREYCPLSGYTGEWDKYIREGNGLMIWPNRDFYRGEWKNGVMSGYGIYIWNAYYNNSMSLPSINVYRGNWDKGLRNGYGILNLGLGFGSYYKGEFKNNKKHGSGQFVTNNGLIIQDKRLFLDDNMAVQAVENTPNDTKRAQILGPLRFDICDSSVGLTYHIEMALKNIDKQKEIRENIIAEYIERNASAEVDSAVRKCEVPECLPLDVQSLIEFEEISLRKALQNYENDLKNIYYTYATICNTEEINFRPVLIRLYLWQLYFDCNVHEKGLNLVEIDRIFNNNPAWLCKSLHNPFEKIYFWQFIHSLISVASRLYAKRELPGVKPDTILASAFRTFMEMDVLPGVGKRKGKLTNGYGSYLPLRGLNTLYGSLGTPHNIRTFLCACRRPPHYAEQPQPLLVDMPDENLPLGRNAYVIGYDMTFNTDYIPCEDEDFYIQRNDLKLFNFGNLSSKAIIMIFAQIFPQLYVNENIMDLNVEITFYEFFEAFVLCAEESIRVKFEEIKWRAKFCPSMDAGISPSKI